MVLIMNEQGFQNHQTTQEMNNIHAGKHYDKQSLNFVQL